MKDNKKKKVVEFLNKDVKKKRKAILLFSLMLLFVIALLVVASYFRNFAEIKLAVNEKKIFTIEDLIVNDLKYGDNEAAVTKSLGKPKSEEEKGINKYDYKILKYDGLTVYLKESYNDFVLSKVEIYSGKYETSRGLKVGSKITKVFNSFKVENSSGAYMYGNYTNKALKDSEIKDNIYYGVRSKENVLYVNRDEIIDGIPTNIAKLDIKYSNGIIKNITWSYDVE
ncbi:MAG: hypothetical protein IKF36_04700 [Bacilli bacterium]|nr:hypothetical protein [Bacilli bacterium]